MGGSCFCGYDCIEKRWIRMGVRAGCRYWSCPLVRNDCGYQEWIDDPFEGEAANALHACMEEISKLYCAQIVERRNLRLEYKRELQNLRNKMLICVVLACVLLTSGYFDDDDATYDYE